MLAYHSSESESEVAQLCLTLCDPMDCSPPSSSVHGILQARIQEWVGCHFLLQGIFPTPGSNPGLPHCKQMLYPLSHQGRHNQTQLLFTTLSSCHLVVAQSWKQVISGRRTKNWNHREPECLGDNNREEQESDTISFLWTLVFIPCVNSCLHIWISLVCA